jgi:hypothetical protein
MSNPPLSQIEARLFRALEKDPRTADANKNALVGCLRAFRQSRADSDYAIAGDLALRVKGIGVGLSPVELEIAVASWASVPVAELEANGFEMRLDRCSLAGSTVRFREVRPAALARAERFGLLPVLGAADALKGKLDDACADWTPAESRAGLIAELEGLLARFSDAFDDVENARGRLVLARRKSETETKAEAKKEIPMTTNPTNLDKAVTIAKALLSLFSVFVLCVGCDGGAGGVPGSDGGAKMDGSTAGTGGQGGSSVYTCAVETASSGTASDQCVVDGRGACLGIAAPINGVSWTQGFCCSGCMDASPCKNVTTAVGCGVCYQPGAVYPESPAGRPQICVMASKVGTWLEACATIPSQFRQGSACEIDSTHAGTCNGTVCQ